NRGESALLWIFVDTSADFFAETPRLNVFDQKGRGPVFFTERLMQKVENIQTRIQTHQVDHLKRTHGMVQSELQRLINIAGAGDAFLQHIESFVPDERIDPRRY